MVCQRRYMSKKTMKAVVYKHTGTIALEERPLPGLLDSRDAVIKVTLTTICSSESTSSTGQSQGRFRELSLDTNLWGLWTRWGRM